MTSWCCGRRRCRPLLARQLVYQGSKYPICSMIRTRKFLQRGWHINAGQYLKMAFQVSELDLVRSGGPGGPAGRRGQRLLPCSSSPPCKSASRPTQISR